MKRRGFLFGLVAAPLAPLVPAKAVAAAPVSRAHLIAPQLLPWSDAWIEVANEHRAQAYSAAKLRAWFKDCPEVMALAAESTAAPGYGKLPKLLDLIAACDGRPPQWPSIGAADVLRFDSVRERSATAGPCGRPSISSFAPPSPPSREPEQ